MILKMILNDPTNYPPKTTIHIGNVTYVCTNLVCSNADNLDRGMIPVIFHDVRIEELFFPALEIFADGQGLYAIKDFAYLMNDQGATLDKLPDQELRPMLMCQSASKDEALYEYCLTGWDEIGASITRASERVSFEEMTAKDIYRAWDELIAEAAQLTDISLGELCERIMHGCTTPFKS